jgi:hypothetical protein
LAWRWALAGFGSGPREHLLRPGKRVKAIEGILGELRKKSENRVQQLSASMDSAFIDITIGAIDEKESYQRSGQFWEKVFSLSSPPPAGWSQKFEEIWAGARYEPKRHARIENGQLATICLAEELHGLHMDFLIAAVERTNAAYRSAWEGGSPRME